MLPINPAVFKAYDIRGLYGQDFDNDLAYRLGQAFVVLRQNDNDYLPGKKLTIAVAADMRLSSPALKESLLRGLTVAGADAVDLGTVSTPTFYFAVAKYGYDGGLMISASHNPKEWNGFKLVRSKGIPISGESGIEDLKKSVLENRFLPAAIAGTVSQNNQALQDELGYTWSLVDRNAIKPFKIVVDTANGMGANYLCPLLTDLPGEQIFLNRELDGNFPAHEADPLKEENLEQLKAAVIREKADFGIAADGDGDRLFFVDNQGKTINQAIIRGLLSQSFLQDKPGAKIGYDVRPGKITADMIEAAGGQAVITRVGHSLIKEQMIKENIYFACESSGHFYLNSPIGCFEFPGLMVLRLLSFFSKKEQAISEQLADYNRYFQSGEINREVADKEAVFQAIKGKYKDGEINELDGVSISYPDFWFNVRGSNTEPKIRLNLEAVSIEKMEEKKNEVLGLIK